MRLLLLMLAACQPTDSTSDSPQAPEAPLNRLIPDGEGRFQAQLPGAGLSATLDAGGLALEDIDGARIHLRTVSIGRSTTLPLEERAPVAADCPEAPLCAVNLHHDGLTEHWESYANGLHQSWTLDALPPGVGPLVLTLRTDGEVLGDGEDLLIVGPDGGLWSYGVLQVRDADGESIPARLYAAGEDIRIEVEVEAARLPLRIDPVLSTATLTVSSSTSNAQLGGAVAGIGDVNADGYDDVLVGAPGVSTSAGAAYLYLGTAGPGSQGGIGATATATLAPLASTYSNFGGAISDAGDVNGDGYDDVVIGAPGHNGATGRIYVYHGTSTGLSSSPATTLNGPAANAAFGGALGGGGDINGDGYDDIVVGAYGYSSNTGRVLVYHGSATGLSTTAATTLNGSSSSYFGRSVAILGDANGDGYDDVAIGAYRVSSIGQVTVYHGSANGLSGTASRTLSGTGTNAQFGYTLDAAGDVDADGYADLIVGAYGANAYFGEVYIYHGAAGTGIRSTATTTLGGPASGDYYGYRVQGVGDTDNDGYDDVAVGAYGTSTLTGAVYVYRGSATGVSTTVDSTLVGTATNASFGQALDGAGDVNGDGFTDVIVGSPGRSSNSGEFSVHHGYSDHDGDGVIGAEDCDDQDLNVGGPVTSYTDADGDGYGDPATEAAACLGGSVVDNALDCDDTDATVSPLGTEGLGDEVDQDCDGTELCFTDADGDGARTADVILSSDADCADAGEASLTAQAGECDDSNSNIHPGATELAGDGVDQDCDAAELCYVDADADGYRVDSTTASPSIDCSAAGVALFTTPDGDCADSDAGIHPGATEGYGDGVDTDCDGREICYSDLDSDDYRTDVLRESGDEDCTDPGEALVEAVAGDCNDSDADTHPGAFELVGDGLDADCDGHEDCYADVDQDGWRSETVQDSDDLDCEDPGERVDDGRAADCDDADGAIHPEATEAVGDLVDSDCDGRELCYIDADGDGHRSEETLTSADVDCDDIAEAANADPADDCDDVDADVFPGATEIRGDGEDQDCDGADLPVEDVETDDTDTPGGDDGDDKGCSSAPAPASGLLAALALLFSRRRR